MSVDGLPPGNRRLGDRRSGDRRLDLPAPADESWFGVLGGAAADSRLAEEAEDIESAGAEPLSGETEPGTDSRFLFRQAQRLVSAGADAFQRIYRAFVGARAALGLALVIAQMVGLLMGVRPPALPLLVCLFYAAQAMALWLLPRFRAPASPKALARLGSPQWLGTIGVDLLVFSLLHLLDASSNFNFVALLVLPVLMAGVLTPRLMALATTSAIALMLLAAAARNGLASGVVALPMTQAGLVGIGFFVITLLAGELASRLAREEQSARGSLALARQQAQLNRLVIEQMQDGVMVVDRRGRVRTANPAARLLLGAHSMCPPAPFSLVGTAAWQALAQALAQAFDEGRWPEIGREIVLPFEPGLSRTLVVRARFTRRSALAVGEASHDRRSGEELCVLFLEDLRSVQTRTRQEKLAAMGRVSAGIAHEIRNPLAAITQANALLQEDMTDPGQQRLSRMVAENAERLKRIVDDVMEVAPGLPASSAVIDASAEVAAACSEWARTVQLPLGDTSRLQAELPNEPIGVRFDPDHLRRVLINLLDNAHRHASDRPGAIRLRLAAQAGGWVGLSVASDGEPIPAEVERHLFEPFFSTRSRGTGLGLYICRELCERYGATIDYRAHDGQQVHRNEFHMAMRRGTLLEPESRLHLGA
jgi:two-component system sensor histidine kinase PilS (NtrC family)